MYMIYGTRNNFIKFKWKNRFNFDVIITKKRPWEAIFKSL